MGQWTEWLVERGWGRGAGCRLSSPASQLSGLARSVTLSEWPPPCKLCFPPYGKVEGDKVSVTGSFP